MDSLPIRLISQIGIYITFVLALLWAVRRGPRTWIPYVGMVGYAVLFEHLNMFRYADEVGGYHYHPASWLFLWNDVPLYIPLAWAFIVSTSFELTNRLGLKFAARPFADALFALLIDLSMDVVAIRLKFWTWHGVPMHDGFFGVPADNFLGWLLVTYAYALLTRLLWRDLETVKRGIPLWVVCLVQWLVLPAVAYVFYRGAEAVAHLLTYLVQADTLVKEIYVLFGIVLVFLSVVLASRERRAKRPSSLRIQHVDDPWIITAKRDPIRVRQDQAFFHRAGVRDGDWGSWIALHGPRQIFHVFAVIGLLCLPANSGSLWLWAIALIVWGIECGLVFALPAQESETENSPDANSKQK